LERPILKTSIMVGPCRPPWWWPLAAPRGGGPQLTPVPPVLSPGYVGAATVGAAAWWFLYAEDGPSVSYHQLVSAGPPGDTPKVPVVAPRSSWWLCHAHGDPKVPVVAPRSSWWPCHPRGGPEVPVRVPVVAPRSS